MGSARSVSRPVLLLALFGLSTAGALAQAPARAPQTATATATASPTAAHVEYLASPKLEGRLTGSPGADLAAAYIETELKRLGAVPLPGATGFRAPFEFTAGVTDEGSSLAIAGTTAR
jgi:aminopeptidase YwaD